MGMITDKQLSAGSGEYSLTPEEVVQIEAHNAPILKSLGLGPEIESVAEAEPLPDARPEQVDDNEAAAEATRLKAERAELLARLEEAPSVQTAIQPRLTEIGARLKALNKAIENQSVIQRHEVYLQVA